MDTSASRCLELQFSNQLALPVLTGQEIKGEGNIPLEVALVDPLTNKVVDSEPEASTAVQVVVLKGDFGGAKGGDWTFEEFNENIVREQEEILAEREEKPERKRKRPLLGGDMCFNLDRGSGCLRNIKFKHCSKWMKRSQFKLGARVHGTLSGIRIKEAVSEPFTLEDRRNMFYKKHYPPSLEDKVCRLVNIGKAFHKRLSNAEVNSVKDFLTQFFLDDKRLQDILGKSMSTEKWEATVRHARTCVLGKKLYLYHASGSQQKKVVVFNVVGQVTGLFSNDQLIYSEQLSETEKTDAHNMVRSAFEDGHKDWHEVDEASLMDAILSLSAIDYSSPPVVADSDCEKSSMGDTYENSEYPGASTSATALIEGLISVDDYISMNNVAVEIFHPLCNPECDLDSKARVIFEDENLQKFNPDFDLQNSFLGLSTEPLRAPSDDLESPVPHNGHRWKKLFGVARWFSIRRIVAVKQLCYTQKIHSVTDDCFVGYM